MPQLVVALVGVTLATASFAADSVSPADAIKHVGEHVRVCGKVVGTKYAQSSRRSPTFLNLDQPYPNQVFTAVIWGDARPKFKTAPELLQGHAICVNGTTTVYKGRAEMEVSDPGQIEEVQETPK